MWSKWVEDCYRLFSQIMSHLWGQSVVVCSHQVVVEGSVGAQWRTNCHRWKSEIINWLSFDRGHHWRVFEVGVGFDDQTGCCKKAHAHNAAPCNLDYWCLQQDFCFTSWIGFGCSDSDLIKLLTSTSFVLITLAVEMWATPWMVEDPRNSFRTSISGKAERELWPKLNWLCQRVRRALTHPVLIILLIRSRSVLSCPPPIFQVCWKPRSFSILLLTRLHALIIKIQIYFNKVWIDHRYRILSQESFTHTFQSSFSGGKDNCIFRNYSNSYARPLVFPRHRHTPHPQFRAFF